MDNYVLIECMSSSRYYHMFMGKYSDDNPNYQGRVLKDEAINKIKLMCATRNKSAEVDIRRHGRAKRVRCFGPNDYRM